MTSIARPTPTHALETAGIAAKSADYAKKARSAGTRRAYGVQLRTFAAWCGQHGVSSLPARPEVLAGFLADSASKGVKIPTLAQALAAISQAHADAGHASPRQDQGVRLVWAGIRAEHATNAKQARAVTPEQLRRMVKAGKGLAGARNRALLLVGFASGCRRSELVALDVADVTDDPEHGLTVRIRRSKTDQLSKGRDVGIPYGSDPATCPVRALRAWLTVSGISSGAIFRGVRYGRLTAHRLIGGDVARTVQAAAKRAHVSSKGLSGHSLRAGLVTAAAKAGKSTRSIMDQTGHKSVATVQRYIRSANIFEDNAAAGIGL